MLPVEEALVELADADCHEAIAALVAERVRLESELILRALEASDDQAISVMCRAAGFKINGYSAILRMRTGRDDALESLVRDLRRAASLVG